MAKAKVHIRAFEEARFKDTDVVEQGGHILATSAYDKRGSGGCCMAFSTKLPFAYIDGHSSGVMVEDCSIVVAEHRGFFCASSGTGFPSSLHLSSRIGQCLRRLRTRIG